MDITYDHLNKPGWKRELIAIWGYAQRNYFLTKRYFWWEVVWLVYSTMNALTIGFIGVNFGGEQAALATTFLLIGTLIWSYLSMIFDLLSETVSWERWEGTIEYTMMAPVRRWTQLFGSVLSAGVGEFFEQNGLLYLPVEQLETLADRLAEAQPLLGLLRPTSGHIEVDGQVLDDAHIRAWQRSIGYVPQQISLMDASVAENIAFGVPEDRIDMDAVKRAAGKALRAVRRGAHHGVAAQHHRLRPGVVQRRHQVDHLAVVGCRRAVDDAIGDLEVRGGRFLRF